MRTNSKKVALILAIAFVAIIGSATAVSALTDFSFISWLTGKQKQTETAVVQPENVSAEDPASETNGEVVHNFPSTMRAVTLKPDVDFIKQSSESAADVQKEIDAALDAAKDLTMNTVIVETTTADYAIYNSATRPDAAAGDMLGYLITGARNRGLYVYCTFDLKATYDGQKLITYPGFDTKLLNSTRVELADFVGKYSPDGIFFTNYDFPETNEAYAAYAANGAGMSYQDYLNNASRSIVTLASETVRSQAPGIQVGLITEPQWATNKENAAGSSTGAEYSMLTDGHSDVKAFIEDKLVDMIAVKAFGSTTDSKTPFAAVVGWWAKLASENGIHMYAVQASDRMGNSSYAGWGAADQMAKQVIAAEKISGFNGSIFNDLTTLKKDPSGATTLLLKYFKNEVSKQYIMTELSVTKPTSLTYSTYEPTVTFRGASDPSEKVTVNGKEIATDKSGYFSVNYDLNPGVNTFTFSQKSKTITFTITRNVKIFQNVTPVGSMTVDGSTEVKLVAYAYENASVTANVNGQSVSLTRDNSEDDNTNKDSFYVKYSGTYKTPAASSGVQNLGAVTFSGTWNGTTQSASGASISVNKAPAVGSGSPVVVTAAQAETFPTDKLDDFSDGNYYPLPKGSLDYTVGDEIVYNDGSNTFRYYKLESGVRVYAKDITSTSDTVGDVAITGMTVTADSSHTSIVLPMSQPTTYTVKYSSSGISFTFNYLKSAPGDISSLTKNPLFSSATWSGDTLTLHFRTSNGMCGYKASYSGNTLTLRFNNVPSSVSGARIVIDPGHGGVDSGALGFYPDKNEDYVNRLIATELASILRGRGANVLLIDTTGSGRVNIQNRASQAESFGPQLFLSVHNNSATSSGARGNEAYYFYQFSAPFARYVDSALYSAMGNYDRGAKYGLYYVTRTTQYTSVLSECGFMSNQDEYVQLMQNYSQIASALANSIGNYFGSIRSGSSATGTQSVGDSNATAATGVGLSANTLAMEVGGSEQLYAVVKPSDATETGVTWSSSNSSVASVDSNGNIKALAAGEATIKVTTKDGGHTDSCSVTVTSSPNASSSNGT